MRRTVRPVGVAVTAAAVACLGLASVAAASPAARAATARAAAARAVTAKGRVTLPSPVPGWAASLTDHGPAGTDVKLSIRLYLAGRSAAAETRFAAAASTPGNPAYARYLTPVRFRSLFGPTAAQTDAVEAWARSAGLTVTGATAHYVAATGTAPKVSAALDTSVHAYGFGSVISAYAPVNGMSVPASLGDDVATVTGLDGYISQGPAASADQAALDRTRTASAGTVSAGTVSVGTTSASTAKAPAAAGGFTCSAWWGQHVSAIPKADGRTSAPDGVCGYTPRQLRSAYGVTPESGKGATIAVVLDGSLASMRADANRFFAAHHGPGFASGQFTVNTGPRFAASCGTYADLPEEALDVETAHIIAPAAKVVYVAADCTSDSNQTGLLDAETRIVDQHLADVATDSYSIAESQFSPATAAAWSLVFEQGAAEGIGFDFDSGDGGDLAGVGADGGTAVTFPASDPWATAAGGTTLEIGRTGTVTGELGWGDDTAAENAAGTGYAQAPPGSFSEGSTGGRSTLFPEPAYQRGVVPTALSTSDGTLPAGREVPDIAADASPVTGWLIGYTGAVTAGAYGQVLEGGTSGASPIVASLEADAKQAAGHAIGFANPLLYDLRHSAGIRDIVPGRSPALALEPNCYADPGQPGPACVFTLGMDSSLAEAPGYDDVTGIGSPTDHFIADLARG
ncbi:MAG: S53 family peptidase [Trebonia sp.]